MPAAIVRRSTSTEKGDFVHKLYNLLHSNEHEAILCWTRDGSMFSINDVSAFTRTILPVLFRHTNFQSFVRQLNKYGFHKVKDYEELYISTEKWIFHHPCFHRDMPDAIISVKRRPTGHSGRQSTASPPHSPTKHTCEDIPARLDALQRRLEETHIHVGHLLARQDAMTEYLAGFETRFAGLMGMISPGASWSSNPHVDVSCLPSEIHFIDQTTSSQSSPDYFTPPEGPRNTVNRSFGYPPEGHPTLRPQDLEVTPISDPYLRWDGDYTSSPPYQEEIPVTSMDMSYRGRQLSRKPPASSYAYPNQDMHLSMK